MDYLEQGNDFAALSVGDLLRARDEFHLHLLHKANVVGTAIGRYRIRKADPWPRAGVSSGTRNAGPRTLQNSEIRPYSYPAILVFVSEWREPQAFSGGSRLRHDDFIPSAVYVSDGRKVPICVVKADVDEMQHSWQAQYTFPTNLIGGGFPLIADVQGEQHIASVGCLVSDGHRTFALTNRHVAGDPGTRISAIIGNNKVEIGTTSTWKRSLTRAPFTSIYSEWPGKNVYVDLDAALIDVDDINQWTTSIYGVGRIGRLADLGPDNLSLRLIGAPVRAFGAASREMSGEIAALFYRFKSVGGFEYVADFLIGPRAGSLSLGTHPGDSGTVWLLDAPDAGEPQPLAMQWGGQEFLGDGGSPQGSSYALATMLSTICNQLDVDIVRGFNIDQVDYWGAVGHYGIAYEAIGHLPAGPLQKLMSANLERITYQIDTDTEANAKGLSTRKYVPLADVPDMVWKVGPYKRGGMKAPEHANHFADMDRELKNPLPQGATLLEICKGQANVSVDIWRKYYDQVKKDYPTEDESRGLLPFRCWQIFDAMVYFLKEKQIASFLCAAGILSHYVGDACQPLHISYLFNGDPDRKVKGKVRNPDGPGTIDGMVAYGTGCHSAYEDKMVDYHVEELWPAVNQKLKSMGNAGVLPASGQDAAKEVVRLMQSTFATIKPMDIVDAYGEDPGMKPRAMADKLWKAFGDDTIDIMADGTDCLARLWQGALKASGAMLQPKDLAEIDEETLSALYQNPAFLQSESLNTIGPVLATGSGGADGSVPIKSSGSGGNKPAAKKKAATKKKAAKKKKG